MHVNYPNILSYLVFVLQTYQCLRVSWLQLILEAKKEDIIGSADAIGSLLFHERFKEEKEEICGVFFAKIAPI